MTKICIVQGFSRFETMMWKDSEHCIMNETTNGRRKNMGKELRKLIQYGGDNSLSRKTNTTHSMTLSNGW